MKFSVLCLLPLLACPLAYSASQPAAPSELRRVISLDDSWEIAQGSMSHPPAEFAAHVPVPGLVDMAIPPFADVGIKSSLREAFWYRRQFEVPAPLPAVAVLKVHKAMFGARVILNGITLGEHLPSFTPGLFDAANALRAGSNQIFIRVGAFRDSVPRHVPSGWDYEKKKFTPGIFDSVELILSGAPQIFRIQAVPRVETESVTIHAWVQPPSPPAPVALRLIVREAASGKVAGEADCTLPPGDGSEQTGSATVRLRGCRLWSPEDPFLYELETRGSGDSLKTRFGMRSFGLDPATGRALLNGKKYFMRGSNITLYRFFEDAERGDKPWRAEWVRRLHQSFRGMHWNSLRYCIGLAPEIWYRIADEEGFLIQDEFPIWNMGPKGGDFDAAELAAEYTEWVQERWNHPSVVIWDSCNETRAPETGEAIRKVRGLDFSNRPWDNGWSAAVAPGDCSEQHPYHFSNPHFKLSGLANDRGTLGWAPGKAPIVINEYGWLWLNRDGTPTTLTRDLYRNLLGDNSTTEQRRRLYARYLAAETEFWRSRRACAAVMHFCALGYSRADGQTSDHWLDVEKLTWEPEFRQQLADAFNPVGVMIDRWMEDYPAGSREDFPVVVINDLPDPCQGEVRFALHGQGATAQLQTRTVQVAAFGTTNALFSLQLPSSPGSYTVEATLLQNLTKPVRSIREFEISTPEQRRARFGIAVGRTATASSSIQKDGATSTAAAVDGQLGTRWSSEFSDPQWIAVDLGQAQRINRVVLAWEAAFARSYSIETSLDGQNWTEAYRTDNGKGGRETLSFAPVQARFVRMHGTKRATQYGYSLFEFQVFPAP